jgi:hypothetical protein
LHFGRDWRCSAGPRSVTSESSIKFPDLPVERSTKFDTIINQGDWHRVLLRADEVIG